jgi:phosphoserine aminotransferase
MKKHNFSAGPAILPQSVFREASQAVLDFNGKGLSLLEISHRSADFQAVMDEAGERVRQLLALPDHYKVLFLQGGASTQFMMVPCNLLPSDGTAAYHNTGSWAKKAIKEARLYGNVDVIGSSEEAGYTFIPKDTVVPNGAAYLHITTNNTIYGTEYHALPDSAAPIVADMSSDIFSRPVPDIERYGLIYAGAQKNLGPAGTTLVVVREDLLGRVERTIPTMLDYRTHIKGGSMFNTPPVFPIYVSMLTLRWIEEQGGLAAMERRNAEKAEALYAEIDRNPLFKGTAAVEDRSRMNVTFVCEDPAHEKPFLEFAAEHGAVGLKGHRSVGGFRASIYNAMERDSVDMLCALMREFATVHA